MSMISKYLCVSRVVELTFFVCMCRPSLANEVRSREPKMRTKIDSAKLIAKYKAYNVDADISLRDVTH